MHAAGHSPLAMSVADITLWAGQLDRCPREPCSPAGPEPALHESAGKLLAPASLARIVTACLTGPVCIAVHVQLYDSSWRHRTAAAGMPHKHSSSREKAACPIAHAEWSAYCSSPSPHRLPSSRRRRRRTWRCPPKAGQTFWLPGWTPQASLKPAGSQCAPLPSPFQARVLAVAWGWGALPHALHSLT